MTAQHGVPAHITRRWVFAQSWPIAIAGALGPLVGIVDTVVIGRTSGTLALAGIGLGAAIYGIVYWGFGFLRMSTAGLAAQSDGANQEADVQAHLLRAVPMGLMIGLIVFALQAILLPLILSIYTASPTIEGEAKLYLAARLWGLPATLGGIALMGWFVGLGQARHAFILQAVLNIVNVGLSVLFVVQMGWGIQGVAYASAIAEWCGFATGLWLATRLISLRGGWQRAKLGLNYLLDKVQLRALMGTNTNIFIRTAAMVFGFNVFANAAAGQGETFLAGNHILMQFITIIALVLDSYAHTAESAVGSAIGARDRPRFDRAVRLTAEYATLSAMALSALLYLGGPFLIDVMTTEPDVRASAKAFLPFCAAVPVLGFAAYHLDGIFIGATRTHAMRNAGVVALLIYLAIHALLAPRFGPQGIWAAFLAYYVARGVSLGVYFPSLRASVPTTPHSETVQGSDPIKGA